MRIQCAQRYRPFSHLPGTLFLLPATSIRLQIFPTHIRADDLSGAVPVHIGSLSVDLKGPVEKFTVMQDLERREISIWGEAANGFMRYRIKGGPHNQILFLFDKLPNKEFKESKPYTLQGSFIEAESSAFVRQSLLQERLSFGNHKAQDWELIKRRADFAEIFPLWHALGQMTLHSAGTHWGTATLLDECRALIAAHRPEKIFFGFQRLWLAGFESALSPRLIDTDFQGILSPSVLLNEGSSPLQLLSEGYQLIRSLFIDEAANGISLLPELPPAFHCGRLLHAQLPSGTIQMEWTKKMMRRMVFASITSGKLRFHFCRGEKSCRVRRSFSDPGTLYASGAELQVEPGSTYWLDRFMK